MAAVAPATPQIEIPQPPQAEPPLTGGIAKLAALHAEAEETARLANLLGRSLYAAIALPVLALLAAGLADGVGLARELVWCAFIGMGSLVMLRSYVHIIAQPFERVALRSFAETISPALLYMGFAWGAGAFLALPVGTNILAAILFVAAPSIAVAALLREREAVFLFLAPAALLASFASVLRPFADGALTAGAILSVCAAIACAVMIAERRRVGELLRPAMLSLR